MKVSDAVVEATAQAIHGADGAYPGWNDLHKYTREEYREMARMALAVALPMVVGEAVAEVRSDQDGDMVIVASKALALGTKLHTLTNLEDAP